jgi:hypothetical protein
MANAGWEQATVDDVPAEWRDPQPIPGTVSSWQGYEAWLRGYNETMSSLAQARTAPTSSAFEDGWDTGVREASDPTYDAPGHEGIPNVDTPSQYQGQADDWQRGFKAGFASYPRQQGPQLTTPGPQPENAEEAREAAETRVHILRELGQEIPESEKAEYEETWREPWPVPPLWIGERPAPNETIPEIELEREREAD